jgi:hydrogenase 3 maturation protease
LESIRDVIRTWLKDAKKLTVLGVGSTLRADDAAGMVLTDRLQAAFQQEKYPELLFCPGETAPENFSGKIRTFKPTHLLSVDAADVGLEPGTITVIDHEEVGGPAFLSHMLPLRVMINYLTDQTGASSLLLGIQYQSMAFDGEMTDEVKAAVDALYDILKEAFTEIWGERK